MGDRPAHAAYAVHAVVRMPDAWPLAWAAGPAPVGALLVLQSRTGRRQAAAWRTAQGLGLGTGRPSAWACGMAPSGGASSGSRLTLLWPYGGLSDRRLWWPAQWRTPGNALCTKARRWMMPRPPANRLSAVKTGTEYNRSLLGRPVPGAMSACALQRLDLALDGPPVLLWQRYRSRDYGARRLAL